MRLFWPQSYWQKFTEDKLGTVAWDGSAPAEEHWECGNPSLGHAKCTSIN
jgi:hypothetical protein